MSHFPKKKEPKTFPEPMVNFSGNFGLIVCEIAEEHHFLFLKSHYSKIFLYFYDFNKQFCYAEHKNKLANN